MSTVLDRALEIAREAHAGQVDKAGRPVIEHVLRVTAEVGTTDAKRVALLHDVLEDCPGWTADRLIAEGIPEQIVVWVCILTRHRDVPYHDYIDFICRCGWPTRTVKIADLRDHLHPDRVGTLKPSHVERYRRALAQLGATLTDGADRAGA